MRVQVIGVGYVGLPMALLLAKAGHEVLGVDLDDDVVEALNRGEAPLPEPGMQALASDPGVRERLRGTKTCGQADVHVIAVPTPLLKPRKVCDMSMVRSALGSIIPHIRKGDLIVLESTVPPLTCREVILPVIESAGWRAGHEVLVAHCPERVLPGRALHEIMHNDRIIGGVNEASTHAAAALYGSFVKGAMVLTDDVTAELCKLMENTYRDVNIALANELARVAATLGVDINRAIDVANRHPRVNLLRPGIGVGGHCIPIDPWFIAEVDPESCRLIPTARQINDAQPDLIAAMIRREVRDISDPKILCVGLTYKPDVVDMRESPAIEVVEGLKKDGYSVNILDPTTDAFRGPPIREAAMGVHLLAVLVPHAAVLDEIRAVRSELSQIMARDRVLSYFRGSAEVL